MKSTPVPLVLNANAGSEKGDALDTAPTPVSAVGNRKVATLAGLGTADKPHPLQTGRAHKYSTHKTALNEQAEDRLDWRAGISSAGARILSLERVWNGGHHPRPLSAISWPAFRVRLHRSSA